MRQKWSCLAVVYVILGVLTLSGCYEPVPAPQVITAPSPAVSMPPGQYRIFGWSVQRYPILGMVYGNGPDVTFVLATIHGNESAGKVLVRRLGRHLNGQPGLLTGRTVVLLPVANPDGMAEGIRYNAHGVDLNRNFAAGNRVSSDESGKGALSEPESRVIEQIIRKYKPDRVVSIHKRTAQAEAIIDYDGPAKPLAERMAQYCRIPVKRIGAMPGSLGSYAGVTLGIPIITFEMHKEASAMDTESLWRVYGKALLAAIVYPQDVR